jgi:multiple sugar transport system ATP-binding protein
MFVAGFIRSPPINFLEARLKQQQGELFVDTTDFALCLPEDMAARARTYVSEPEIALGIRPQDIHEMGHAPSMPWRDNKIVATIDVLEPLGDAIVATVIAGKQVFQVTLTPETDTKLDRPIVLVVDMGKIHLFDLKTKGAIV